MEAEQKRRTARAAGTQLVNGVMPYRLLQRLLAGQEFGAGGLHLFSQLFETIGLDNIVLRPQREGFFVDPPAGKTC